MSLIQATSVYEFNGKSKHLCTLRANVYVATAATVAIATASISLLDRVELITITLGSMNLDLYASTATAQWWAVASYNCYSLL